LAQYGDLPQKTREYLDNIQDSAKWLLKIINDILDISKIESGKIVLENIPFDLPDIFEHCQASITPKTKEKGIMLYCYAEPSVGKKLLGDPVRVRQVLTNLLSNAVKFTNVGTVKLLASVASKEENRVTINFEIKDSGIGMTKEQIDKIFEPFTQADESVTRRFGGTGLGLTITKNIIELMGGSLMVESTVGVGSRFSFALSFDMIDDTFSDKFAQKIVVNEYEKPQFMGEILVCEDNSLNQQVICDHLARVGIKTVVAHNGKEGVDIVAQRLKRNAEPFDLIFMDIHMPIMDGLDAATQIAAMGVKTPIVALTANVMSNDLELYRISGMADTVGKPFTTQELWRCLVKYIPVESYTTVDSTRQSAEEDIMLKKVKVNFVKTNQNTFNEFAKALKDGDGKQAHRLAHTLKSNAGQIGEKRLQSAAAEAEGVLSEGVGLITKEHIHAIETELRLVLDGLAPLLEEAKAEVKTEPVDNEKLLIILDRLEPLLENMDTDCLSVIEDLQGVPDAQELIDQIEGYQYEAALLTLENLRKELR
ncbi:MAG: ATP-binding protein, partial [Oscillospiraceae bacterium]|nr:ATP-binding protein [Oscillospiraceae bacterium]